MSRYVDGFVIPLKKKNLKAYIKMAKMGRDVWMEHGALDFYECVGAKLDSPWGISFAKVFKLKPGETVVFSFIVYKSKAHRDRVVKKVHADKRMQADQFLVMPFDMKRFTTGEFKTVVHAGK